MGRERLIKSVGAHSLTWKPTEEGAVDRVTAIGFAAHRNEMGETMLRVNALDGSALKKAIFLVTRQLVHRTHLGRDFARKLAIAALHELLRPQCIYCNGRGQQFQKSSVVRVCHYCQGTGLHRYSDTERELLIGGAGKYNECAYEKALSFARDSLRTIVINADRRLID